VASHRLPASAHDTFKPLFWCQTIAVLAFGAAWLVKGETLFRESRAAADEGDPGPISTPAVPTNPTASCGP
jgi:hypothetical protein